MDQYEQRRFIRDMTAAIQNECLNEISIGRVPKNWDGHELRCWLADKFERSAKGTCIRKNPRIRRSQNYKNTLAVNNI